MGVSAAADGTARTLIASSDMKTLRQLFRPYITEEKNISGKIKV